MSSTGAVVDANLALERAGGNADLARELYQMLQNELPVFEVKIRTLYQTGDIPALTEAVHKLHGSATYCGVPQLKTAAEALEICLKRGESEQYQQELDGVLQAIRQVLQTPVLPL